jgi:formylglycine-generating enzyme required for sulfatase activity
LIQGRTVQERLTGSPLPLSEIKAIFAQLLSAVAFAHVNNIVHRDLKPANILLEQRDQDTRVILTDFGIARSVGMNTETGAIMGTPAYMSPEQAQGEHGDARSDIYSLGIILYELATGRRPFSADSALALALKQISHTPEPPSVYNPDLPTEIESVILTALNKSPAARYQTVDEMRAALGLLEADQPAFRTTDVPVPGEPPYKGLQYFDENDVALFHGRTALTQELAARLTRERFLAVVGASGSGKSSVVRAGLIPAWHHGLETPTGKTTGAVHVITPTAHPLESLAASLTRDSESVTATATLTDDLLKDPRSLHLFVRKLLLRSNESHLLIVVDQFEETFTLCKDISERKAFIDNLLTAAADSTDGPVRVVLTLRADFYQHCAEHDGLRQTLQQHQAFIGAMSTDELRAAIEAPAKENGWALQEGLTDLILQDVGEEPGTLPLLSHALLETWKRRQGRTLTLTGYAAAGGVRKAITQTAENVYSKLQPEEQTIARNIFLRLTELGEGVQDSRRRASRAELRSNQNNATEVVLKILTDARLITATQDTVEVAHEALIREWPALRGWLAEDREKLRLHRHLATSASEWDRRGREPGDLYRGARLAQAQEWLTNDGVALSPLEHDFIEASQNIVRREQRARMMRWAGLAAAGALVMLIVTLALTGQLNPLIYRPLDMQDHWVTIPAGEFQMGSDSGNTDEQPVHVVALDAFEMGRYEVTNRQYAQCVRAGICNKPDNTYYYPSPDFALYPVTDVSWFDAQTYCEWIGGELPTEAQWEKAARGGLMGRQYPWGDQSPVCGFAMDNGANFNYVTLHCGGSVEPVGEYKANAFGLYDMAGNVWEWTADWYDANYYRTAGQNSVNPFGAFSGVSKVLRGGAWNYSEQYLRVAARFSYDPDLRYDYVGFRCAR